ncbi:hypothetical protein TNCV_2679071 [Trichonephila clavipes]|nr:hypothetical protein TNCV_2679071 [Trichonephila clavipes]
MIKTNTVKTKRVVCKNFNVFNERPLNPQAWDSQDSSRSVSQPVFLKVSLRAGSSELVSSELHHGATFSSSLIVGSHRTVIYVLEHKFRRGGEGVLTLKVEREESVCCAGSTEWKVVRQNVNGFEWRDGLIFHRFVFVGGIRCVFQVTVTGFVGYGVTKAIIPFFPILLKISGMPYARGGEPLWINVPFLSKEVFNEV